MKKWCWRWRFSGFISKKSMSITSKCQATLHNADDQETSTSIITPYLDAHLCRATLVIDAVLFYTDGRGSKKSPVFVPSFVNDPLPVHHSPVWWLFFRNFRNIDPEVWWCTRRTPFCDFVGAKPKRCGTSQENRPSSSEEKFKYLFFFTWDTVTCIAESYICHTIKPPFSLIL